MAIYLIKFAIFFFIPVGHKFKLTMLSFFLLALCIVISTSIAKLFAATKKFTGNHPYWAKNLIETKEKNISLNQGGPFSIAQTMVFMAENKNLITFFEKKRDFTLCKIFDKWDKNLNKV